MVVAHKVYGIVDFSSRLITSEISQELRELLKTINEELNGCGWKILDIGYEPNLNEWHYFVSACYIVTAFDIIHGVVERHTKNRVFGLMHGVDVKC